MQITELYSRLKEAYSNKNLNSITGRLVELNKNKQSSYFKQIANVVSEYIELSQKNDARLFYQLIMLYHPDKGEQYRNEIDALYAQNNLEGLESYSHIFELENIDEATFISIDEDIDYKPEYVWDRPTNEGYESDNDEQSEEYERSFYNLIKIREYGHTGIEFPSYYLEDFEEFEMAYSGLETLDGVQHCIHVKILDVSHNQITDISELWDLENLEELFLNNNQIGYIDALSNLTNLKILDLSNNQIDDVSPLFQLPDLEYVNLTGNPVKEEDLKGFIDRDVLVIF